MSNVVQERVDAIKANNPMRAVAERVLGPPSETCVTYDKYLSPFRNELNPSLVVYDDHYHDFGGVGDVAHGDVIDFIQAIYNMSFKDACEHLDGQYQFSQQQIAAYNQRKANRQVKTPSLSMAKAKNLNDQLHFYKDKASQYLSNRVADKFAMTNWGYNTAYTHKYKLLTGEIVSFDSPMVAFPNIAPWKGEKTVWEIKYRLDATQAWINYKHLKESNDNQWHKAWLNLTEVLGHEPSDNELFDVMFNRFASDSNGVQTIWNTSLLLNPDNTLRRWPYIFIVEGQFCMGSMCQLGFPTVLVPDKKDVWSILPKWLAGVQNVIVVADDDDSGYGLTRANNIANAIGKKARVKMPPNGAHDMNEAIMQDNGLSWLEDYNPILKY